MIEGQSNGVMRASVDGIVYFMRDDLRFRNDNSFGYRLLPVSYDANDASWASPTEQHTHFDGIEVSREQLVAER